VLIVRPVGSDGEIEKVTGEVPPLAVTGVDEEEATVAVNVSDAITSVVVSAAETVSEKVAVALPAAESVTVTVYVVAALLDAGVPVIAPVELLIDKPEGSPGVTA
jgi:hypothetical protein